jgi:hypothetical protein
MEWVGLIIAVLIGLGIFLSIKEKYDTLPLKKEVRERGLERLVIDTDGSADPDVKIGYVDGIKVLYWDEDCFETAKKLLAWRDRSPR